jgi:hypothetical protein
LSRERSIDSTPFRDPTFALEHGVAELEDVARQRLLERHNRPPPNVISARVERVTLRAGVSQGLDRQAYALTVGDLPADSFAGKPQHFFRVSVPFSVCRKSAVRVERKDFNQVSG